MAAGGGLANQFNAMSIGNPGFVYLIVEGNNPNGPFNYKVGQSEKPDVRVGKLQTGNPRKQSE